METLTTGIGHQVNEEIKKLLACKSSLEQAYAALKGSKAVALSHKINALILEVNEYACSAQDAINQDR